MSTMGTFDAFTTARLGIYAAQLGLQVTGNNVSNINTEGYTRQRLDQVSFKAGAYDRYRSQMDNHVGSGALVMNINQIRDPYLDVRFRNTRADVGYTDRMLAGLQEVADILDEIGKGENPEDNEKGDGLLHAQIQDLAEKLRAYEAEPTKTNNDLVRTSAQILCGLFKDYSDKLERLYQDTLKDFDDQVTEINECLTNIRDLNREIRDCEIYGDNALELRDERNRQIDTLSQYLHIKVIYTEESIGSGQTVEKLSIYLDDDNPDKTIHTDESMLIDGVFGAQLYRTPVPNPNFDPDQDPAAGNEPYLDKDGNPVLELKDAAVTDNFDLSISKLLDIKDQEWKGVSTVYEKVDAATQAIIDKLSKSTTKDETDSGWTVKEPATKAVYGFNFTPSGVKWVDGNTFTIAGTNYKVGDTAAGADISVDDANDPEKLAAFICGKLAQDPEYTGKYNVRIDPANPTTILFEAQNAGAIPVSERPRLGAKAGTDPEGKLTFSTRQVITAGKDAVLTPPAEKTDPDTPEENAETITSYQQINGEWNKVSTIIRHTKVVDLDDNDLHGSLQATRELLTEKGEFTTPDEVKLDEDAAEKRGLPYYQLSLDLLARQFATQYNKINVGYMQDENGNYINERGELLELGSVPGVPISAVNGLTDAQKQALTDAGLVDKDGNPDITQWLEKTTTLADGSPNPDGAVKMGGVLFSNRNDNDDPSNITAANISVSHSWSNGSVSLVPTYKVLFLEEDGKKVPHSTQSDNAGHMLNMIEKGLVYNPRDLVADAVSTKLFEGNFNDMFSNMNTICGQDIRANDIALNNSYTQLVEIDTQRDGVSGVDLNDEAMNMMQFQKALNAAMRMMTVIDEALDRLINNTGVAGR